MKRIGKVTLIFTLFVMIYGLFLTQSNVVLAKDWKIGINERIRNVFYNNILDFDDSNDGDLSRFYRVRTSVWGQYDITPNILVNLKLTNEHRPYLSNNKKASQDDLHEVFVDNFYAKIKVGEKMPLTLTLGRQNIIYGEGFVILDGSPNDGSRSIYHDGVKASLALNKTTTIDLFGFIDTETDTIFPLINDQDQSMANQDEQAFGLYVTNTAVKDLKLEGYFINKTEKYEPDNLSLNTIGARVSRGMKNKLAFASEFALQMGSRGDVDYSAFGGYAHVSYLACEKRKGILKAGLNYLSGDDPETSDKVEGWNPLFSRWPKWSELYIYSQVYETGKVAYWTNTLSPYIQFTVDLCSKANFSATFYHLKALQKTPFVIGGWTPEGTTRGNEIQLLFKFNFNKNFTGHFLYDQFMQGDFYPDTRTQGRFVRAEIMYNFTY